MTTGHREEKEPDLDTYFFKHSQVYDESVCLHCAGNSIDHYRALISWDASPGILGETSPQLLRSVKVEEVDEGKTVIGTMFEVHKNQRDQLS